MLWFVIPAALILAALAAVYIVYRVAFYAPLPHREDIYDIPKEEQYQDQRELMVSLIREMDAIPYEEVNIISYDGTPLFARYYHVADGAPLQIQMHGWRGSAIRDFCGGNKLAREAGLNTLVTDQRAHGRSGGTVITFGLRERYDCLAWARWAAERFPGVPITLAGVSMGSSTVLMAAGLELPETVRGVIADCPFSSPAEIVKKVCRDWHVTPAVGYPLAALGARLFGRFDLGGTDVLCQIRKAKVPVLLLHGEDDRFVPCQMSRDIYDACPTEKRLVTFPGAGHGLSYIVDPEKYADAVRQFLRDIRADASSVRPTTEENAI